MKAWRPMWTYEPSGLHYFCEACQREMSRQQTLPASPIPQPKSPG